MRAKRNYSKNRDYSFFSERRIQERYRSLVKGMENEQKKGWQYWEEEPLSEWDLMPRPLHQIEHIEDYIEQLFERAVMR